MQKTIYYNYNITCKNKFVYLYAGNPDDLPQTRNTLKCFRQILFG